MIRCWEEDREIDTVATRVRSGDSSGCNWKRVQIQRKEELSDLMIQYMLVLRMRGELPIISEF